MLIEPATLSDDTHDRICMHQLISINLVISLYDNFSKNMLIPVGTYFPTLLFHSVCA